MSLKLDPDPVFTKGPNLNQVRIRIHNKLYGFRELSNCGISETLSGPAYFLLHGFSEGSNGPKKYNLNPHIS